MVRRFAVICSATLLALPMRVGVAQSARTEPMPHWMPPRYVADPFPWVLIAWNSEIRIYLDSTRVEQHRPASLGSVWLRFVHTHPQPTSPSPNAPRARTIDVQASLDCQTLRNHVYHVEVRDSLEQVLSDKPVSPTGQQQTDAESIAKNAVGVACLWLRDPGRRPVQF